MSDNDDNNQQQGACWNYLRLLTLVVRPTAVGTR